MARRSVPPPKPRSPILTAGQKRRRIERLQKCITSLEAFDYQKMRKRFGNPEVVTLEAAIDKALSSAFGYGTPAYLRHNQAATLDPDPQGPRFAAPSCLQLVDHEATMLTKCAEISRRTRSGRSPCSGRRSAHLKTKLPMQNRS